MSSNHANEVTEGKSERPLWIALILTTTFLIAEVVGGVLTNSLALISDAAHMFTDSAALAVSLVAIRIGRRAADSLRTFGYYRFEFWLRRSTRRCCFWWRCTSCTKPISGSIIRRRYRPVRCWLWQH